MTFPPNGIKKRKTRPGASELEGACDAQHSERPGRAFYASRWERNKQKKSPLKIYHA